MPISVRDRVAGFTGQSSEDLTLKPTKMMSVAAPETISPETAYNQLVLFKAGRFAEFSKEQMNKLNADFKKYDINGDNFLDLQEVKRMMELMKVTMTHIETKQAIAEIDKDKDGLISYEEYLAMNAAPVAEDNAPVVESRLHRIMTTSLASHYTFHNDKIGSQTDLTQTNEQRIKAEAAERRRMKELKATAAAAEAAEIANKAAEDQARKDRLKAKSAMFEVK